MKEVRRTKRHDNNCTDDVIIPTISPLPLSAMHNMHTWAVMSICDSRLIWQMNSPCILPLLSG